MWRLLLLCLSVGMADAKDRVLLIGTAMSIEPYAFRQSESGIELDTIRAAMALRGIQVNYAFYPLARLQRAFDADEVAAITPVSSDLKIANMHLSTSHIQYQNVVITTQERKLQINRFGDLAMLDIVAFQRAKDYLGPSFAAMANANPKYHEQARQDLQVAWLMQHKTDAIVLDIKIFHYWNNRLPTDVLPLPVDIHYLFPASPYSVGFRSAGLRDLFDEGLKALQQSGGVEKIIQRYLVNDR